jgi:hypothetical protein
MFQHQIKIFAFLMLLACTNLIAQSYTALYNVKGTRDYVPLKAELTLPDNWEIRKSNNPKRSDTLANKTKGISTGISIFDLGHQSPEQYLKKMVEYGYKQSTVDGKNMIIQISKDNVGKEYLGMRMVFGKKTLSTTVFPPKGESLSSLSAEIEELKHILTSINLSSAPDERAIAEVKKRKYADIKKEIDKELASTTLINDDANLKDVHSFCLSLQVIPFKYSQDKKAPQSIKDYAKNAIDMCKGKLYTSALTNHLKTKGKTSCSQLKKAFDDDFFIKGALRKSGDEHMWDTLQREYKTACTN